MWQNKREIIESGDSTGIPITALALIIDTIFLFVKDIEIPLLTKAVDCITITRNATEVDISEEIMSK